MTKCRTIYIILFSISMLAAPALHAQLPDTTKPEIPVDSLPEVAAPVSRPSLIDSVLKNHSPKKAALRSALIPGWGQAYNKKYWKIPIVYGALGVSGAVFVFNLKNYRDLRFAYSARFRASQGDSSDLPFVKPLLRDIDLNALKGYRDEFRRNIDYSALVFIALWGLNVVDAVVDAHLKTFDVSPDLSFNFRAGHSEMAGTTGISLVVSIK